MSAKSTIGKKRNASSNKLQSKPSKSRKTIDEQIDQTSNQEPKKESEGLFDNLDEQMDEADLEELVKQINTDDESSEDTVEEESDDEGDNESESVDTNSLAEKEDVPEEEDTQDKMDEDTQQSEQSTASKFRNLYMTKVTQAFGTDLDQIRQEPNFNNVRLNILIDSLEAGIDIFSNVEQEIILADEEK